MPRKPSENRIKAHDLYDLHHGNITNREIANQLGISEKTVAGWKCKDNWSMERSTPIKNTKGTPKNQSTPKKKKGGQPGNQNAKGKNLHNQNARKHGLFSKWLPPAINEIIKEMPTDPLDIVWYNIELQWANIMHAQKILHVENKEDKVQEVTMEGENVTAYEIQQAWDRQARTLKANGRALVDLDRMIRSYYEILDRRKDTASDYQMGRIQLLEAQRNKIEVDSGKEDAHEDDGFIAAIEHSGVGDWTDEEI